MSRIATLEAVVIPAIMARAGHQTGQQIRFRCPIPERHQNGDAHPSAEYHTGKHVWCCRVCKAGGGVRALADLLGVQVPNPNGAARQVVESYNYDEYIIDRVEPGRGGRAKDFMARLLSVAPGDWRNYKIGKVRRTLYRLTEALALPGALVIPEGERKADRLLEHGIAATAYPFGAGKWCDEYCALIPADRQVVVLADRDEAGQAGGRRVADSIARSGRRVAWAALPGDRSHNDVVDYLRAGGSVEDLKRAIAEAAPWAAPAAEAVNNTPPGESAQGDLLGSLEKEISEAAPGLADAASRVAFAEKILPQVTRLPSLARKQVLDTLDKALGGGQKRELAKGLKNEVSKASRASRATARQSMSGDGDGSRAILPLVPHAQVLGELDRDVLLFDARKKRIRAVEDLGEIDLAVLVRYFGSEFLEFVRETKGDDDDPTMHIREVRYRIAALAYRRPIPPQRIWGQGIWLPSDGGLLVVCGSDVLRWDGRRAEPVESPILADGLAWPDPALAWDDAERLVAAATAMTDAQARDVFDQLVSLLQRWESRFQEDPEVLAGAFVATLVQAIWAWRSLMAVHGPWHAGKSALADLFARLAGKLAFLRDGKLTEAALRQEIRRDSRAAFLDEFEKNPHRDAILQLFRISGRGGEISRGTRDHRPITFALRHIIWTFSIDSGARHGADISRSIVIELKMPTRKENPIPAKKEVDELGAALRALALRVGLPARELADRLSSTEIPGLVRRQVENLAAPFAIVGVARGMDDDAIRARLTEYARAYADTEREVGPEASDEERLLEAISAAKVRIPEEEAAGDRIVYVQRDLAVGQLLQEGGDDRLLQANGISNYEDGVFLAPTRFSEDFLGRDWQGIDLRRILLRVAGARVTKRVLAGRQARGIILPKESLYTPSRTSNVPLNVPRYPPPPQTVNHQRDTRDTRDTSLTDIDDIFLARWKSVVQDGRDPLTICAYDHKEPHADAQYRHGSRILCGICRPPPEHIPPPAWRSIEEAA